MHADARAYLDSYKLTDATRAFVSKRQAMFIDGKWVQGSAEHLDVIEPSTEGLLTQSPAGPPRMSTTPLAPQGVSSTAVAGASCGRSRGNDAS